MWLCLLHARREDKRAHLDGTRQLPGDRRRAAADTGLGPAADHVWCCARERRRAVLHLGGLPRGTRIDHCLRWPGHLLEAPHDRREQHVAAERLRHGLADGARLHPACCSSVRWPGAAVGQPGACTGQPRVHARIPAGLHGPCLLRVQRHRLQAAGEAGRRLPRRGEPGQADLRHRLQRPRLQHAAERARGRGLRHRDPRLGLLLLRQDHVGPEAREVGGRLQLEQVWWATLCWHLAVHQRSCSSFGIMHQANQPFGKSWAD
mmetsp:Transcript_2428/g.4897  ORF Transcript_2428/g.4897 Transcript_2428/m.4897 type:complete len:262 (+) Transcript_2428:768-1553(+)